MSGFRLGKFLKSPWMGVLISGGFLYLFMRQIDWRQVWEIIKSINYTYIVLAASVQMLVYFFRAKRWRSLLLPLKKEMSYFSVFSATIIGFMGNNIFPFRMGEIMRAYIIGNREGVSKTASMTTIVLERLFDGFSVLLLLIWLLWFFPFSTGRANEIVNPQNLKKWGFISAGLYFAIIFILFAVKSNKERLLNYLKKAMSPKFSHLYEKTEAVCESFLSGMDGLKSGRLVSISIDSVLVWLLISVTFYSMYPAFHFNLPFSSAILLVVVVALIVAVPASPGFVGTFHFACATCLILLGIEPNQAKSFALILHLVTFVPVTLLGLFFVYQEKINLKEIQAMENEA